MFLVAVLAILLLAVAVGLGVTAVRQPQQRRSENLGQIEAYGYAGRVQAPKPGRQARQSLDALAASIGDAIASRLKVLREEEIQSELISAGFYRIGARRFLGYRMLLTIALPIVAIWFFGLLGTSAFVLFILALIGAIVGWMGPSFVVHRRSRIRLQEIDDSLPALIDLLVVTLEAGVAFTGALAMSAERLEGPLGDEVRLTMQEQTLGLSTLEALEHWLRRCDTPGVRSFVRAMVQGDRLGVSIGHILRNQAFEMRARQKAVIEERAQKAPIKILFPLVFLIFPAMFVIILAPALFRLAGTFH